jgi:hypothetical protein
VGVGDEIVGESRNERGGKGGKGKERKPRMWAGWWRQKNECTAVLVFKHRNAKQMLRIVQMGDGRGQRTGSRVKIVPVRSTR